MMIKNVFLYDFFSKTAKTKYASTKKAIVISKEDPSELYPDFDFFVELLNSENQIICKRQVEMHLARKTILHLPERKKMV